MARSSCWILNLTVMVLAASLVVPAHAAPPQWERRASFPVCLPGEDPSLDVSPAPDLRQVVFASDRSLPGEKVATLVEEQYRDVSSPAQEFTEENAKIGINEVPKVDEPKKAEREFDPQLQAQAPLNLNVLGGGWLSTSWGTFKDGLSRAGQVPVRLMPYVTYAASVVILGIIGLTFLFKEMNMGICHSTKSLRDKVAVVTGASEGVGFETAKMLAARNALVIVASSNLIKGSRAAARIREETGNRFVRYVHIDLSSFASVKKFAKEFTEHNDVLDFLVNNAGIVASEIRATEDNLDTVMQTNFLGHFLLTNLLSKCMKRSVQPKVINVINALHGLSDAPDLESFAAPADEGTFSWQRYASSKFASTVFTGELARRWGGENLSCFAVHPGFVRTSQYSKIPLSLSAGLGLSLAGFIMGKSSWQGAQTVVHVIAEDKLENGLYSNCRKSNILNNKAADDTSLGGKLWKKSAELVGIDPDFISESANA